MGKKRRNKKKGTKKRKSKKKGTKKRGKKRPAKKGKKRSTKRRKGKKPSKKRKSKGKKRRTKKKLGGKKGKRKANRAKKVRPFKVGGKVKGAKCLASAGYEWCESFSKCVRRWEVKCPSLMKKNKKKATKKSKKVTPTQRKRQKRGQSSEKMVGGSATLAPEYRGENYAGLWFVTTGGNQTHAYINVRKDKTCLFLDTKKKLLTRSKKFKCHWKLSKAKEISLDLDMPKSVAKKVGKWMGSPSVQLKKVIRNGVCHHCKKMLGMWKISALGSSAVVKLLKNRTCQFYTLSAKSKRLYKSEICIWTVEKGNLQMELSYNPKNKLMKKMSRANKINMKKLTGFRPVLCKKGFKKVMIKSNLD